MAGRFQNGYGAFAITHNKTIRAHRYAFGPTEVLVLHRCDNPPCCNPRHLFDGTHQDNYDDMNSKGRRGTRRGTEFSHAKLNDAAVRYIRASTEQSKDLAVRFGVSRTIISLARNRHTWKHVE